MGAKKPVKWVRIRRPYREPVSYYLDLPWTYTLEKRGKNGFTITCINFGKSAEGESLQEAYANIQALLFEAISKTIINNESLPLYRNQGIHGQFEYVNERLRVPCVYKLSLNAHSKLCWKAKEKGLIVDDVINDMLLRIKLVAAVRDKD